MDVTWIALAASLMMGLGAACFFVYAVKGDHFRDIESTKYQVFWSDLEELVDQPDPHHPKEPEKDGSSSESHE